VYAFVVHPGAVDPSRVEGDVVAQRLVAARRLPVAPAHRGDSPSADDRVEVVRGPLELTPRRPRVAFGQQIGAHIGRWYVDGRRVAGLEHTQGVARVGQRLAVQLDSDAPLARHDGRWAWVVPDSFHITYVRVRWLRPAPEEELPELAT
jgi:hypothetical protein